MNLNLFSLFFLLALWFPSLKAQSNEPIITAWTKSTGKGYKGYLTNVIRIDYSAKFVYVYTNSIPSYSIGPWQSNPNDAMSKNFTFKFPRVLRKNNGTAIQSPLGHIGLWLNGVSIYNADDGMSYNNQGIWKRNAYVFEGISFDGCKGHPDQNGEYHHHISPDCLYSKSSSVHSPLLGFTFDGVPIYGPYGYSLANDSSSSIKRMITSYKLRNISSRISLVDGTSLSSSQYGPSVDSTYPLGSFL